MGRELGAFETALTLSDAFAPLNVVVVLRLAAGPPTAALRRALDALQRRHPLLRVRIRRDEGRYYFDERLVPPIPLRREARGAGDAWIAAAEAELGERLDAAGGPLVRCTYLRPAGDGPCDLLLTFHHAIMDAASATSLCRELLAACADPRPQIADAGPMPLLAATDALLPPPWRGFGRRWRLGRFLLRLLGSEVADRWRARGRWHPPAVEPARNRILSFQLSADETAALVRRSRRRRLTLHSVLDAAQLLAVARLLYPDKTHSRKDLPLRHLVFADLRPYLWPPIGAEHLGSYFAMLRFTTRVRPESGLFELADRINARVHAAGRRGAKYAFSLTSAAAMRGLLRLASQRMAATALSYTGPLRLDAAGPFPVQAFHSFVANFHLGPESAAQARLFAGRLWWDILTLDSDLDPEAARRLGGEIRDLLTSEEETSK